MYIYTGFKLYNFCNFHFQFQHQCDICNESFERKSSLTEHKDTLHKPKVSYKCKLCPTTRGRPRDMLLHYDQKHPDDSLRAYEQVAPEKKTGRLEAINFLFLLNIENLITFAQNLARKSKKATTSVSPETETNSTSTSVTLGAVPSVPIAGSSSSAEAPAPQVLVSDGEGEHLTFSNIDKFR